VLVMVGEGDDVLAAGGKREERAQSRTTNHGEGYVRTEPGLLPRAYTPAFPHTARRVC
jgi:hypothetical protein